MKNDKNKFPTPFYYYFKFSLTLHLHSDTLAHSHFQMMNVENAGLSRLFKSNLPNQTFQINPFPDK